MQRHIVNNVREGSLRYRLHNRDLRRGILRRLCRRTVDHSAHHAG